ncbi:18580_t:CDS:2, partial [Gigaspora margarita]
MSSNKQKEKTTLSNQQRKKIIAFKKKNPNISYVDLVDWVKKNVGPEVYPSTIGHLIKNKDNIGDNLLAKRQKTVQYPNLENSLLDEDAFINDNVVAAAISKLRRLLENYDLKDIYNMNETELFYDLEEYIDYLEKLKVHGILSDQEIVNLATNLELKNDSNENDNSTKIHQVTYNEALNTINLLEEYL